MSARTLVLRDWGRVVRDPIDVLRAAFFAGALVFAIRGELGGVANLLVAGGALLVARAVNLPRLDDLGFTIAMILGSNLQLSNRDTVGDLIADTLGSAAGGPLLVAWTKFGWGSVRRIPGQSRYEDTRA
jgi:hypothetical protein